MYKYLLFASLLGLGTSGIIESGAGGGWQSGSFDLGGGYDHSSIDNGQGHGSSDGSIGGDFHHGVSVVSTGGNHKGAIFDLTNHGGDGHQGSFGGSFVASSKYSHAGGGQGDHGGYSVSEGTGFADHYSDVLGASESAGGSEAHSEGSVGGSHEGLSSFHGGSFGGGYELGYH